MTAGCSAGVSRFSSVDDVFTASTPNQKQIINNNNQPFPADSVAAAPIDATSTGSVSRGSLAPVSTAASAPAAAKSVQTSGLAQPSRSLDAAAAVATTAPVRQPAQPAMASAESEPAGWSRAGGTQVTAKEGETVYNLSRRFGVPANVILQTNGLSESEGLKVGQKVVIPTYVYSSKAPVSAPDSNPKTAAAKSSRGNKELPAEKPAEVAVLPQPPKPKDSKTAAVATADGTQAKAAGSGSYTVQSGDTLSAISKKTGVGVAALKQANGLNDGVLKIGQTLKVPAGGAVVASAAKKVDPVTTGTTGAAKPAKATEMAAYTPPKKSEKLIAEAEEDKSPAPNATGIDKMRWPVRGRVVSNYGSGGGKSSDGIDIAVPEGTSVKAAENGVVIYAGDGLKEFGNTVLVRHENGLVTVYGNASALKVARGEKVKRGQEIAVSGMSGNAASPKLHFEVRKNSAPVDPSTYLE